MIRIWDAHLSLLPCTHALGISGHEHIKKGQIHKPRSSDFKLIKTWLHYSDTIAPHSVSVANLYLCDGAHHGNMDVLQSGYAQTDDDIDHSISLTLGTDFVRALGPRSKYLILELCIPAYGDPPNCGIKARSREISTIFKIRW